MPRQATTTEAPKRRRAPAAEPAPETAESTAEPAAPTGSLLDQFTPLADSDDYLRVLLYGEPGSGKTTAAAMASKYGRTLIVNAEGGTKRQALASHGANVDQIWLWPQQGESVTFASLERLHADLLDELNQNPGSVFCVVLDSLTEIHHALRENATAKRVANATRMVDPDYVDRDDYNVMTNQMRRLIRRFRDLPCHVVITALEKTDDETKATRPALTPALSTDVLGYMDIVAYCRATQDGSVESDFEFRAMTRPGRTTQAKDRFGVLPRVMINPTFDRILGYLRGDLAEQDDDLQLAYYERVEAQAAEAAKAAEAKQERRAARRS